MRIVIKEIIWQIFDPAYRIFKKGEDVSINYLYQKSVEKHYWIYGLKILLLLATIDWKKKILNFLSLF